METDMLWISEGCMQDDAGNLIITSYVDLRGSGSRTPIRTLVKGCKHQHALEDSETILVSALERFRKEGENLIRDPQEGFAKEESETVKPETPEQASQRRRIEDLNEAVELVDAGMKLRLSVAHRSVERSSESLAFGTEWWIFSTAIAPETDEEWAAWRATLDPAYDHESVIGQPAKFAEALARMVAEQLGPQGDGAWMTSAVGDSPEVRSEHRGQWVIHGPVVYADSVYEALSQEEDEVSRIAASMFTKSASHAAMREYRFVILRDRDAAEKVLLRISGMMRDALEPTTHGLVRVAPAPAEAATEVKAAEPTRSKQSSEVRHIRATSTERVAERTARELVTKGTDGRILASESEQQEEVRERTVTHDLEPEDGLPAPTAAVGSKDTQHDTREMEKPGDKGAGGEPALDDEAAVKALAIGHGVATGEADSEGDGPAVDSGAGQVFRMFEEMFEDPACPMPSTSERWAEAALGPEEVHRMYGFVATLAHKVTRVSPEHRQDAASACWHAIQCIRNIFVGLGDIVATASIERGRFVVLELKESAELRANGRIVLAPSGVYAYCLKRTRHRRMGYGEGPLGRVFFPMGSELEEWDSLGWRAKEDARAGEHGTTGVERDDGSRTSLAGLSGRRAGQPASVGPSPSVATTGADLRPPPSPAVRPGLHPTTCASPAAPRISSTRSKCACQTPSPCPPPKRSWSGAGAPRRHEYPSAKATVWYGARGAAPVGTMRRRAINGAVHKTTRTRPDGAAAYPAEADDSAGRGLLVSRSGIYTASCQHRHPRPDLTGTSAPTVVVQAGVRATVCAAGYGFDQPPAKRRVSGERAVIDRVQVRRRGRRSGRQEGLRRHQAAPFKAFSFVVRFVVRVFYFIVYIDIFVDAASNGR